MKDKLVVLIGGGGFVGRYVAQELLAAGARVRIAQRRPRDAWFLKPLGDLGQTQFVAADVTRPDSVAAAVAGADAVINLAGVLKGDFDAVNAGGARNVAEAAKAAGVGTLIHFSALGAEADSASAYGRTKAAGEAAVRQAFPDAILLRPSFIFGREDQFTNRFAAMVGMGPVVPVLRADVRFQSVYVVDVARAVAAALADPEAHAGKTYALAGADTLTMAGLFRWLAGATGHNPTFVELPDAIGALIAALPGTPITRDQWRMLQADNVAGDLPGLAALGVVPTPLATAAPAWLVRYRRHGRFGKLAA
ncbi:complex I NDUFA9 subunit family protein [Sphingomonas sp. NIBR02145]|uniref:complex I NDUFA9 subunit family protein n=1 Tax=Sphingomonas sp. NIBR02145 TaxID=3014784 RepID=UPI0022B4B595|nr:complex I NDUFA9 subunit family protein [Sphingomonas sp. NIBR02145]WHU01710.1 complex I NDUFA9 subunit family protein [Sphingomonas sp. NIBR02145]